MHAYRRWLVLPLLLFALAAAAQAPSTPTQELPSEEQLRERIAAVEEAGGIDDAQRKLLLEQYQLALERLAAAENYAAATRELEQLVKTAPEQVRRLQAQAEQVQASPPAVGDADLDRIQQLLAQEKATLAGLQSQLTELENQLRQAQARPARAREELAAAKLRRQELQRELQGPLPQEQNERLAQARQAAQQAQRLALGNQIRMLEQELLSNDAKLSVLTAQRDLARLRVEAQAEQVRALDELANQRSLSEAAQSAQQAAEAAIGAQPLVREVAAVNSELSEQLATLISQLEATAADQRRLQRQLDQLQARYQTTEQQLEIAGLSQALGDVLRRERHSLPSVSQVARRLDARQQRIAELRLRQFQLDQERQSRESIERQAARLLAERMSDIDPEQAPQIAARLRELLTDRADLHQKLSINYNRYADQLLEINRIEQQLAAQTLTYQDLLDESLFWIASGHPVGLQWLVGIWQSLGWLLDGGHWAATLRELGTQLAEQPLPVIVTALLVLLLITARPRLRRQLTATAAPVGTEQDHIGLTVLALWYTLLLALPWPLLVGALGALLGSGGDSTSFAYAVGAGLDSTAQAALIIEAFRQLCRDRGVAEVHFRWRQVSRRSLRRHLTWLLLVALPVGFLISLTETQPDELHRDSLGRLAFAAGSAALATFAWQILRPRFLLVRGLDRERRRGWWRIRRLLRLVTTTVPLALMLLALYGYYYTALQLESRLITTGWLLIGLLIVGNLALRWIRLAQQRWTSATPKPESPRGIGGRTELDLATADEQTRTLLTVAITTVAAVGLWFIWSDLLPAFNILEGVTLWEAAGGEGAPLVRVTVGDLALAIMMVILTLVAAKNLPGVLEIAILHRLAIDPGNRYAVTSIIRYLIISVGLLIAIGLLGVRWNQAQWLVAALGVGLGFGLQEIFANFVSGLILLFERPIRVGDAVTVGDLSGRVARIRIRATTITDWDRRELIIPNKAFITGQLVNWTLSDQVTRVIVKLRVPFNAEPDEVRQLMLDCALENRRVLRDPEPYAFINGLDDSALELQLNVFVKELGDRLATRHELYTEILRRLGELGIIIPYPQRDVHIRDFPGSPNPG